MPRTAATRLRGEVAGERSQDRDPAADRRLEAERRSRPAGDRLELRPVVGEHVLVRRHDRQPGAERRRDQRPGGLLAAHQLDDDVRLARREEVGRRVRQQPRRQSPPRGRLDVAHRDPRQLEGRPAVDRELVPALGQRPDDLPTHRARAENGDSQHLPAHRVIVAEGWGRNPVARRAPDATKPARRRAPAHGSSLPGILALAVMAGARRPGPVASQRHNSGIAVAGADTLALP